MGSSKMCVTIRKNTNLQHTRALRMIETPLVGSIRSKIGKNYKEKGRLTNHIKPFKW